MGYVPIPRVPFWMAQNVLPMNSLLLKILAVMIACLILLLVILRRTSIGIGVRTTQNIFTEQIDNISVSTWLLVILILIELLVFALLFFSSKPRV